MWDEYDAWDNGFSKLAFGASLRILPTICKELREGLRIAESKVTGWSFEHRIPHEMIEASFMREALRHLPLENQMSHASHASHTSHPQEESKARSTLHPPTKQPTRKEKAKETESKLERAGAPALGGRLKQTTERGEAEVAKADRPQPRRGASAAANTRKSFSRLEV